MRGGLASTEREWRSARWRFVGSSELVSFDRGDFLQSILRIQCGVDSNTKCVQTRWEGEKGVSCKNQNIRPTSPSSSTAFLASSYEIRIAFTTWFLKVYIDSWCRLTLNQNDLINLSSGSAGAIIASSLELSDATALDWRSAQPEEPWMGE